MPVFRYGRKLGHGKKQPSPSTPMAPLCAAATVALRWNMWCVGELFLRSLRMDVNRVIRTVFSHWTDTHKETLLRGSWSSGGEAPSCLTEAGPGLGFRRRKGVLALTAEWRRITITKHLLHNRTKLASEHPVFGSALPASTLFFSRHFWILPCGCIAMRPSGAPDIAS